MAASALKLLWGVVNKALEKCRVSVGARVTEFDRATRRATVQPQVRLRTLDGQTQERAPLPSRPVVLPRGGGFGIWFDLAPNDPVVTLVADEDHRAFYETGQPMTPLFGVRHNVGDAVVFPGGVPDPEQQTVNGEGQMAVGAEDLTATILLSRATLADPTQAGKVEIRVSVRLDLGGTSGLPVARSTDPVKPDLNLVGIVGKLATAVPEAGITPVELDLFENKMGTIDDRPDAKVYSE